MEISIIVPFHRGKNYLRDCLSSICDQNMTGFETLLVLDHVEEEISDLLEQFSSPAALRILELSETRGTAAARNMGLDFAKGKYVYFLDSDDYIMKDTLKEMYREAGYHQDADVIIGTIEKTWYKRRSFLEEYQKREEFHTDSQDKPLTKKEILDLYMEKEQGILGLLLKRELLEQYKIRFPEELVVYSDLPFQSKVFRTMEKAVFSENGVYVKRLHNDPIKLPSLDQKAIPDRHIQYVKSFLMSRDASEGDADLQKILERRFYDYFIQLYQKKFLPRKGQLLPGTQFKIVCEAMKQCRSEQLKEFDPKIRKLLKGFYEEREGKCIFYGTLSMGLSKFKKSRTKRTAIYRMLGVFSFKSFP